MTQATDRRGAGRKRRPGRDFFSYSAEASPEKVGGLIREGQLAILAGPFNVGKSPLLADLSIHLIRGLPWLGHAVQRCTVVAFDLESPGPTYRRNFLNLCQRLKVPPPRVPDELDIYLEHDKLSRPSTAALLRALDSRDLQPRLDLIEGALKRKPDAAVLIDPLEMLIPIDTLKKSHVLSLYSHFRTLLANYPKAALLLTFNLRKGDRSLQAVSLLDQPRLWLEEVCGSLDIVNRSDLRLGMTLYSQDEEIRVINGLRRGEEMQPFLVRSVGDPGNLAGFELVPAEMLDWELSLSPKSGAYWRKLPASFRFEEMADNIVPHSSLARLVARAKSLGILTEQDGIYRKQPVEAHKLGPGASNGI